MIIGEIQLSETVDGINFPDVVQLKFVVYAILR